MTTKITYSEKRLKYQTGDAPVDMTDDEVRALKTLEKKYKLYLFEEKEVTKEFKAYAFTTPYWFLNPENLFLLDE